MNHRSGNQEVEIRAILGRGQRQVVWRKLLDFGAKLKSREKLVDEYFCPSEVKSFRQIEMNKVGSYSLRLRESRGRSSFKIELNVKIITKQGDHNSWEEHEIRVDSFKEARRILQTLGFKSYFQIEKTRYTFLMGQFSVLLEDVKNFGPMLEVEVLTTKSKSRQAKENIKKLLHKLQIKKEQIVTKSVTNLLMHQWAKFQ